MSQGPLTGRAWQGGGLERWPVACGPCPLLLRVESQTRAEGAPRQSGAVGRAGGEVDWGTGTPGASPRALPPALTGSHFSPCWKREGVGNLVGFSHHAPHPFLTHPHLSAAPNSPPGNDVMKRWG